MLMALLLGSLRSIGPVNLISRRQEPVSLRAALVAIERKIAAEGKAALTTSESRTWNTAVVISYMSLGPLGYVPDDARVLSWPAARAGFEDMELPAAAELVSSLVKELAYRAESDPRNRRSDDESLLRLADLKQKFLSIDEEHNLWERLRQLVERPVR